MNGNANLNEPSTEMAETTTVDAPAEYKPAKMEAAREPDSIVSTTVFGGKEAWELAQRQALMLCTTDMVPKQYQGRDKVGNCIIALDMAYRMGASPLMIMQNLYVVHGNPGWSSKFLIATFNQCGRFTAIRYTMERDSDDKPFACRAWTEEKRTGERLEGTRVTLDMAKAEGWSTKAGSKWLTMPELMLQYRAAAFLIRTYAPEISMGLHSVEEVEDIAAVTVPPKTMRLPLRLSQAQMNDIAARIENGVTTQEEVIAKYPDLVEDQKEEIMELVFNAAGND